MRSICKLRNFRAHSYIYDLASDVAEYCLLSYYSLSFYYTSLISFLSRCSEVATKPGAFQRRFIYYKKVNLKEFKAIILYAFHLVNRCSYATKLTIKSFVFTSWASPIKLSDFIRSSTSEVHNQGVSL